MFRRAARPTAVTQSTLALPPQVFVFPLYALAGICLMEYINNYGICLRNHRGAEPPRDPEPSGSVPTLGGRARAPASHTAAHRVKAPAGAARGRFRGIHGGRTAPALPPEARTTSGGG